MKQNKNLMDELFSFLWSSITETGKFNFTIKASESMLRLIVWNFLSLLVFRGVNELEDKNNKYLCKKKKVQSYMRV